MVDEVEEYLAKDLEDYVFYPVYTPIISIRGMFPNVRIISVKTWTRGEGVYENSRYSEYIQMNKPIPGITVKKIFWHWIKDSSNNCYAAIRGHCNNYFYTKILYQMTEQKQQDYFYARCKWNKYNRSYIEIIKALKKELKQTDYHDHKEGSDFILRCHNINLKYNHGGKDLEEEEKLEEYIRTASSFRDAIKRAKEIIQAWPSQQTKISR